MERNVKCLHAECSAVDGNRSVVEVQPDRVNVDLFSSLTACRRSLEDLARMLCSL